MRIVAVVLLALCGAPLVGSAQLLPPPNDGDIRAVYWDLRNQTEIFLTIDPHAARGTPPAGMHLTFSREFAGRTAPAPATGETAIDVKAYAGMLWAPRAELSFTIDGERVQLASSPALELAGPGREYVAASTTAAVLERIGAADRVTGDALGFEFELTDAQRAAFRAFVARLQRKQ